MGRIVVQLAHQKALIAGVNHRVWQRAATPGSQQSFDHATQRLTYWPAVKLSRDNAHSGEFT